MASEQNTVVTVESGKIEGCYLDNLYIFKGIPYAAPPIGQLRWIPPRPEPKWDGVRPAKEFSPIAPQELMPNAAMEAIRIEQPQSEDCLYLNIWSPGLDDARRPVMVWIHGGAFNMGSGSEPTCDAAKLSSRGDVVVVTINYRIGLLGFLNLNLVTDGKIPSTGNEGLLDQIAALRWVRNNIAAFGGDPDNVTVFGESAGGMSIGCLLAMPDSKGLINKAILQSGVGSTVSLLDAGVMLAGKFLDYFGIDAHDANSLLSLTTEQLLTANHDLKKAMARQEEEDLRITVTAPVIDGKTIPEIPMESIKKGSAAGINVIAGTNLEEWKLLCMTDVNLPNLDEAGLISRLDYYLPKGYSQGLVEAYRKARAGYGADTSIPEMLKAIQTDRMFRMPCLKFIDAQSRHSPSTYNYLFTWESPALGGILGACHGLDIGFVFGTYDASFHGTGPAAEKLSLEMMDAWIAFAKTGDPSCERLGTWLPYGRERNTMILGTDSHPEQAPYEGERLAWDAVPDFFTGEIRVESTE
ncbi:MAG: carboxylesterase/lipase family protein [Dehalococcoidales bacterium]|nr:carboxylesterase/lipase family protein [Dehalococcoidales bacterium]